MNNIAQKVTELKDANQDFEYYPTTDTMLQVVADHLEGVTLYDNTGRHDKKDYFKLLDIGAGEGQFHKFMRNKAISEQEYSDNVFLSIEKSPILRKSLIHDRNQIVGSDFFETNLVLLPCDIVFSNPPYSQYIPWCEKIATESQSKYIYLVIPHRWQTSSLKDTFKESGWSTQIIYNGSFIDAERAARAKINVLVLHKNDTDKSVFDTLAAQVFGDDSPKDLDDEPTAQDSSIVAANPIDFVKNLVSAYDRRNDSLMQSFEALKVMDRGILDVLDIKPADALKRVSAKIKDVRSEYWERFLQTYPLFTGSLTYDSRQKILAQMSMVNMQDFTLENVRNLILFLTKNYQHYHSEQIVKLYATFSYNRQNVRPYKSNEKLFSSGKWRIDTGYERFVNDEKQPLHAKIYEKKIVVTGFIESYRTSLTTANENVIHDLLTVAKTLGFQGVDSFTDAHTRTLPFTETFTHDNGNKELMRVKAFKNGNIHIFMTLPFINRFNIVVAKHLNWLHSKEDFEKEAAVKVSDDDWNTLSDPVTLKHENNGQLLLN